MPLYRTDFGATPGKLIPHQPFTNESDLQQTFETSLLQPMGMRFVAAGLNTKDGGIIDTLAIDDENRPVIIEYKMFPTEYHLTQGHNYWDSVTKQPRIIEDALRSVRIRRRPLIHSTRLILVAPRFTARVVDKAKLAHHVELIQFTRYIGYVAVSNALHRLSADDRRLDDHLRRTRNFAARRAFLDLREHLMQLDDMEEAIGATGITYRHQGPFARVVFQRDRLVVFGAGAPPDGAVPVATGPHTWRIAIEDAREVAALAGVFERSYASTMAIGVPPIGSIR